MQADSAADAHKNISLQLDDYDEIFSDFDPRPHSEKALSVDFLEEAKRASIDKPTGQLELRLLIPEKLRDHGIESVIKKRLKSHFEKHAKEMDAEKRRVVRRGTTFVLSGILIMFITAVILYEYPVPNLAVNFLIVLFEPAGWFLFWEGLDIVLFESKEVLPELEFNKKMAKAYINFQSY